MKSSGITNTQKLNSVGMQPCQREFPLPSFSDKTVVNKQKNKVFAPAS